MSNSNYWNYLWSCTGYSKWTFDFFIWIISMYSMKGNYEPLYHYYNMWKQFVIRSFILFRNHRMFCTVEFFHGVMLTNKSWKYLMTVWFAPPVVAAMLALVWWCMFDILSSGHPLHTNTQLTRPLGHLSPLTLISFTGSFPALQ